jgi:hypothetical protein
MQNIQLWVIPEDGTATVIAGAPYVQPEDGASALYRHDRRVQEFPKTIAEVPIDTKLRFQVRGCNHIRLGVKHKLLRYQVLEGFHGGSH